MGVKYSLWHWPFIAQMSDILSPKEMDLLCDEEIFLIFAFN